MYLSLNHERNHLLQVCNLSRRVANGVVMVHYLTTLQKETCWQLFGACCYRGCGLAGHTRQCSHCHYGMSVALANFARRQLLHGLVERQLLMHVCRLRSCF